MPRPPALEAVNLVKVYRGGVVALKGLSTRIPMGSLFCLAGPNGAGKTTFIRISATVIRPSSGRVEVMGYSVTEEPWRVRRLVSLMPQEASPFSSTLRVFEAVYYYMLARGFSMLEAREEARRVLEELDLWQHRSRLVMELSGGLRRRVLLAMALATGAEVVFLDEPTAGLDPEARRATWGYVKRLSREGQTIVFSTHQLTEAENVADSVLLIESGRRVAEGSPRELVAKLPYRYKVVVSTEKLPDWVAESGYRVREYGSIAYVYARSSEEALRIAEEVLLEGGEARVKPVDLEDVFAEVVGGA
ncbi:MAG: ABC transporter ATP-binding protein [Thermoprotei archaeon]|nr:MAG: ABC transporter ATP-binding protein [Thermoprotei archaeon]